MSIQTQIDRISSEVSNQSELLDVALGLIDGKAAGGGGVLLPSGIGGISSGTVTLTETPTSSFIFEHGMNATPNFLFMVLQDPLPSPAPSVMTAYFQVMKSHAKVANDGGTYAYNYLYVRYYYKDDGTKAASSGSGSTTIFSDTQVSIAQTAAFQNMLPGYTYRWICARIDGLE